MNKKIVIPAVAAVAVAGIGTAAYISMNRVDPKTAVAGAFLSLTAEREKMPLEALFGVKELAEAQMANPYEEKMSITFLDTSEKNYEVFKNASVSIDSKSDNAAYKSDATIGIGIGGVDIAEMNLYVDEDEFDVSVPSLLDTVFSLKYGDDIPDSTYQKSFVNNLIKASGFDLQMLAEGLKQGRELSEYVKNERDSFTPNGFVQKIQETGKIKELYDQTTVEKVGKVKTTVDGAEVDAVQYKVTIPNDAAVALFKVVMDDYREFLEKMMNAQGNSLAAANYDFEAFDKAVQGFDDNFGDITMDVVVRKDGKMGSFTYEIPVLEGKIQGLEKITGELNCKGGYVVGAVADGSITVEGENTLKCEFSQDSQFTADSAWTNAMNIAVMFDDQKYAVDYDWDYQIPEKDYTLNLSVLEGEKELIKVNSEGILECEEKGVDLNLEADSLKIAIDAAGTQMDCEFELGYKAAPYDEEIAAPVKNVVDVLAITEDDVNKMIEEVTGKVFGLLLQLSSIVG